MNSVMQIGDYILYMFEGEKHWEGTSKDLMTAKNERLENFIFSSEFLKEARKHYMK